MTTSDMLRYTRIPTHGSGPIPAAGFGTLIPDPLVTKQATKTALEAGFRHLDCAERYRNQAAVGEAIQEAFTAGTLLREDLFVTTKLWNTNHRPERVKPAFEASCRRLQLDHIDCYIIHTPFAFRPGDEQLLPVDWSIGHYIGEAAGDRSGRADQACHGADRIASVSSRMGVTRLLSRARDCAAGVCCAGAWHGAKLIGRPGDYSHRRASAQDTGSSRAGLGRTAR
jgi:Aldo/keto reductase family